VGFIILPIYAQILSKYLINFPDIPHVKKLKGEENSWRYRKGDWRFIFALEYKIVDDKKVSVAL